MRIQRSVLWLLILAGPVATSMAKLNLPMPRHYVEDKAEIVDAQHEQSLNGLLQELEQRTGVQYIILTLPSLGGESVESLGLRLAHDEWRLGQKGKDNGLLFLIAMKEQRFRFEVGYGLEGIIPDAYTGRVQREVLKPRLKAGQTSLGIYQANLQVVQQIAQAQNIHLTGMPTLAPIPVTQPRGRHRGLPCCGLLPMLIFMAILFGGGGRGGGMWLFLPLLMGGRSHYGGFGGGYSSSGSSFGGGFGGFGGGGGGGFGGGGSSGGW